MTRKQYKTNTNVSTCRTRRELITPKEATRKKNEHEKLSRGRTRCSGGPDLGAFERDFTSDSRSLHIVEDSQEEWGSFLVGTRIRSRLKRGRWGTTRGQRRGTRAPGRARRRGATPLCFSGRLRAHSTARSCVACGLSLDRKKFSSINVFVMLCPM